MSSRRAWTIGISALMSSAVWSPAQAASPVQDYVFEVPVSVKNVDPHLVKGTVTCEILVPSTRAHAAQGEMMVAGSGSGSFAVSRGSFQGRVSVPVSVIRAFPPMTYSCQVDLAISDGRSVISCVGAGSARHCAAAGWAQLDQDEMVVLADGDVPPPASSDPPKTRSAAPSSGRAPDGAHLRKRE